MEVPRHWRKKQWMYGLRVVADVKPDGTIVGMSEGPNSALQYAGGEIGMRVAMRLESKTMEAAAAVEPSADSTVMPLLQFIQEPQM